MQEVVAYATNTGKLYLTKRDARVQEIIDAFFKMAEYSEEISITKTEHLFLEKMMPIVVNFVRREEECRD